MGRALEMITALATAPSTGAAAAACTDAPSANSLTIRDSRKAIRMLDVWATKQAVGSVRFTSPFLHDTTVGMHMAAPSGTAILMRGMAQELKTQDTIDITIEGSGTSGDCEHVSFLVSYDDLPGISGRYISPTELKRRGMEIYAFENNLSTDTGCCYSGGEAITAEQDQLRANTDYAILGCTVQVGVHAVSWTGPDWGYLRQGMPTITEEQWHNAFYFREISEIYGLPLIPVFNSSNKELVEVSAVTDENGTDLVLSTVCQRLR